MNEIFQSSIHLSMFRSVLRPSLSIFSCRFLSQTSLLPYEIDRFNAARVRMEDWPENTENIRERLTGLYSPIFTFFTSAIR